MPHFNCFLFGHDVLVLIFPLEFFKTFLWMRWGGTIGFGMSFGNKRKKKIKRSKVCEVYRSKQRAQLILKGNNQ